MSEREKRKAEWLSRSLEQSVHKQLENRLRAILQMEANKRTEEQLALLSQHKDLATQISDSLGVSARRKRMKAEHEREVEEAPDVLEAKLRQLADLIETSARVVFHTGAGLSTAAGIPDFRGPQGIWTLQKKGQAAGMSMRYEEAQPTRAHMAIGEMVRSGLVTHLVSQNVDGLLLRADVPPNRLSELHGCVYTDYCPSCGRRYVRSYDVTAANGTSFRRHVTGRACEGWPPAGVATSAEQAGMTSEGVGISGEEGSRLDAGAGVKSEERESEGEGFRENEHRFSTQIGWGTADVSWGDAKDGLVCQAEKEADTEKPPTDRTRGVPVTAHTRPAEGACKRNGFVRRSSEPGEGCEMEVKGNGKACDVGKKASERAERGKAAGFASQRCGAQLRDTIVHFGERLDEDTLRTARAACEGADLAVVLGSSLKVPPASTLPGLAKKVVIINLQWTGKDKKAALKINGRCEGVMVRLAELLGLAVPEYDVQADPILSGDPVELGLVLPRKHEESLKAGVGAALRNSESGVRKDRQKASRARAAFPQPAILADRIQKPM